MDRGTDVKVRQTLLNRCVFLQKLFLYMFMMFVNFVRLGGFRQVDVRQNKKNILLILMNCKTGQDTTSPQSSLKPPQIPKINIKYTP